MNAKSLQNQGYSVDLKTGVWKKTTNIDIKYSDGDAVEKDIYQLLKQTEDRSTLSSELQSKIHDWPTQYHFSNLRANLLRPILPVLQNKDVLEIGAGCGAITRFLGESCANVLAVEGTLRRASIARLRCRDLTNVEVVSDCFESFSIDAKFDVITLIGVLEYAPLFTADKSPFTAMLKQVKAMLKPGGKVVIAIENQLGLKYFSGAREDHLGIPMYGVENRYKNDQPKTFGKVQLRQLLYEAGLKNQVFYYPFPDYKLPKVVVTEKAFKESCLEVLPLIKTAVNKDPQLPEFTAFSQDMVWEKIIQNQLGEALSNSFLICADANTITDLDSGNTELAYYYNTERKAQYCKEMIMKKNNSNSVELRRRRLDTKTSTIDGQNSFIQWRLEDSEVMLRGSRLSDQLREIVMFDDWELEDVTSILQRYLLYIKKKNEEINKNEFLISIDAVVPGHFIDLIPQNIMVCENIEWRDFDLEWGLSDNITCGFLIFRCLSQLLDECKSFSRSIHIGEITRGDFLFSAFSALNFTLTKEILEEYFKIEQQFLTEALGHNVIFNLGLGASLCREKSIFQHAEILNTNNNSLTELVRGQESSISQYSNSFSWRITRPMRKLKRLLTR